MKSLEDRDAYVRQMTRRITLYFIESKNIESARLKVICHPVPNLHKIINAIDYIYAGGDLHRYVELLNQAFWGCAIDSYPHGKIRGILFEFINEARLDLYADIGHR